MDEVIVHEVPKIWVIPGDLGARGLTLLVMLSSTREIRRVHLS